MPHLRRLLAATLGLCLACAQATEINSANEAELDSVKGFGPRHTARILAARAHGPFTDWADFMARVKGIQAATARKLSANGLTVNQQPYPGAPAQAPR